MANDPADAILERNVARMIHRWADPLPPVQVDVACRSFLRRLETPAPEAPSKPSSGGRLGFAAALLLGAISFWAIFSWRGDRGGPPGPGTAAGPAQSDDDALIQKLQSS